MHIHALAIVGMVTLAASNDWARTHPDVMQEYRIQYTPPSGVTNWTFFDDTFRACADRGARSYGDNLRGLVTICSIESRGAQAAAAQEADRARIQDHRAQVRKASEAAVAKRRADIAEHQPEAIRKWLGALLGYRVAMAEDRRDEARTEIVKERKYSRVGGVINKAAIYEAQQKIRANDELIEHQRDTAKENDVKILDRKDERVARVQKCIDSNYDPERSSGITAQDIDEVIQAAKSFEIDGQDCLWILLLLRATEP